MEEVIRGWCVVGYCSREGIYGVRSIFDGFHFSGIKVSKVSDISKISKWRD